MKILVVEIRGEICEKTRALASRCVLKYVAENELGISFQSIEVENNNFGKPEFKNIEHFHFNISHSGRYVLCGISSKPIGIDIEEIKPIEYETLAREFFTSSEADYILHGDKHAQLSKFYEVWTLKESYLKCTGVGLSQALDSFSMTLEDRVYVMDNGGNRVNYNCHFRRLVLDSAYKAALCSREALSLLEIVHCSYNGGQIERSDDVLIIYD